MRELRPLGGIERARFLVAAALRAVDDAGRRDRDAAEARETLLGAVEVVSLHFSLPRLAKPPPGFPIGRKRREHDEVTPLSASSTVFTEDHVRYLAERTVADDRFMADLKREAAAAGIPQIQISPEQASFMQVLLKLSRTRDVVEVGTLAGYSAIAMARALPPDGRVRTIELEPKHASFAETWIAKSDVAGRVEVLRGAGVDVLPRIPSGSADACFIDADKANYPTYLDECLRILRPGGLVLVDNAFAFGHVLETSDDASVRAIQAFNDKMAKDERLHGVIVPIGDGLWVAVKR